MADLVASLRRSPSTDEGTFGLLSFGSQAVRTLELPWRENRPQRSCIPTGSYPCRIVQSPRFGRCYGVFSVPGRSAILIHPANLAGDVELGWTSQLHGCIAPCLKAGAMRNTAGRMQAAGLVSRPAVLQLESWAAGRPFTLEVSWP